METQIMNTITQYLIPSATAAIGWFAGTRKRKNDFLKDLQESINLLSNENRKLLEDITQVNKEVIALRRENEELKLSVDRLCSENSQLKAEVRKLHTGTAKQRHTRQRTAKQAPSPAANQADRQS